MREGGEAMHSFTPRGVCSRHIAFELDGDALRSVQFTGGCDGNLKAIAKLVEGKPAAGVAQLLRGNTCGPRSTSCADQLAQAIEGALEQH